MTDPADVDRSSTLRDDPLEMGSFQLVVILGAHATSHVLPQAGAAVVIGRDPECAVCIDDPSISRRHAKLVIGESLTVEDLGSANGTRVRDVTATPHQPMPVGIGEVIDLGAAMVIVQRNTRAVAARRLFTHGHFEVRLEDECARAARSNGSFALLRLHQEHAAPTSELAAVLVEHLESDDVVGIYGPGEYEALVLDADPDEGERLAAAIGATLEQRGLRVKIGCAHYPGDGRSPYGIAALASARARGEKVAPTGTVVVRDPAMQRLHKLVERVAAGDITVLFLGETGVGKEVVAEALHQLSRRASGPYLRLNCGALSETLLESELFGHEKGAFTGAVQAKPGLFETAEGGTVFLDEVGELPMSTQVKLLRVLEERQVLRVGALKPRPIDVRFVAATNRDLEADVERGTFRRDLYFRLNGISIVIPPLRERRSEIPALAKTFLRQAGERMGFDVPALSPEALAVLERYDWPGNIRELRNFMERAVILATDGLVLPEHLPLEKMTPTVASRSAAGGTRSDRLREDMAHVQKQAILDALAQAGGNQTEAARLLGVSRRTLTNWLNQHAIERPRKR